MENINETVTVEPVNTVDIEPAPVVSNNVVGDALAKSLTALPNTSVKPDPLGLVILGFGIIGVGATGYGIYRGVKFIVDKVKSNKKDIPVAKEVKEEPAKTEEAAE